MPSERQSMLACYHRLLQVQVRCIAVQARCIAVQAQALALAVCLAYRFPFRQRESTCGQCTALAQGAAGRQLWDTRSRTLQGACNNHLLHYTVQT